MTANAMRLIKFTPKPKPATAEPLPPFAQKAIRLLAVKPYGAAVFEKMFDELLAEHDQAVKGGA